MQHLDLFELPRRGRGGVVFDSAEELRDALRDGRRRVDNGRTGPSESGRRLAALRGRAEFQAGLVDFFQQIVGGFLDVLWEPRLLVILECRVQPRD